MATIAQLEQELAQVAEEFSRLVDQANALQRAGDRGPEFQRLSERIRELRAQRVRINQELSALRAAQIPQSAASSVATSSAAASQNPAVAPQSVNAAGTVATTPAQTVPTNAEKFNPAAQETTGTNDTLRPAERTQATPATAHSAWQIFPAGARSGLLLHDLLQWQCEHGWPLAQDDTTEAALAHGAWPGLVARKAMALGLTEAQTALIHPWLHALLRTPLPTPALDAPPLILGQLKPTQAWAEMPFTLAVSSASTQAIDALISAHVLPGLARRALWPQRLNGMLTGVMDLVFEHHGRYGVLDYKANRLDNYQSPDLDAAVMDHRYDVQYVLYTLALHRLLQVRLPNYDYDQHMGGAVYVFLRGIDQAGAGVHLHRPARALIEALDALLKKEVA